jgi:hypothetical protein
VPGITFARPFLGGGEPGLTGSLRRRPDFQTPGRGGAAAAAAAVSNRYSSRGRDSVQGPAREAAPWAGSGASPVRIESKESAIANSPRHGIA